MGRRDCVLVFAALWVLHAAPALAETIWAAEPYYLGAAFGITGTGAPYSKEAVEGIELAVDEINAEGGFLGRHRIELFVEDTRTDPLVAEDVVQKLIRDRNVHAVIGTYSSATALAIKPICRRNKVLHIATISNSEDITRLDPSPYTFSVVPNTYMLSNAVAEGVAGLARRNGWTRYATIASDYAWGRSSQAVQVTKLSEIAPEVKLVKAFWPRLGQTRFNSFAVALLNERPDFVLASIAGADNALWLRDLREYRLRKKIALPGGLISVTELQSRARTLRRGVYARTRAPFFAHLDVPMMNAFVDAYRRRFDRYPSDWAVMAYDGVYALKQGVEKAGEIASVRVKDAMRGLQIDTTRGRLSFRKIDNQLSCSAYFGRVADDPRFRFPIYDDLVELPGEAAWRPESEIRSARTGPR